MAALSPASFIPGVAWPGEMIPGYLAFEPAPADAPAVMFSLGTPYFQWALEEPYLS